MVTDLHTPQTSLARRSVLTGAHPTLRAMRVMFLVWVLVIVAVITYFSVIGLTHH
jgi:hypothetical protein